ncbi:exosome complex protein Rrp42 [Candidatus Woesearchaeota archaeon]|nr:MAG: exosome complex protein Rrp42 [Candidatus Woesearchaeota archaeon]
MSNDLKEHISAALKKGVRLDGRKLDEFRPITIETGTVATAEGSAHLRCGETEIIAGIKLAVGTPYPDRPDSGTLMVNAELRPISNPEFEIGPPSIESIEVSRVIDRTIRESGTIDEKKLCITPGEQVWMVNVDVVPLNTDGNLIDLGCLASVAALKNTKLPRLEDGVVNYKELTQEGLPLSEEPIAVTVVKIGENFLVDPTQGEFDVADARLTVGSLADGTLCALQKGGDASLTPEDIDRMVDIALATAKKLRKLLE